MNIASYLEKHGLSQEQFAKKLGVSQGLIWQWINGRTKISPDRALRIEEATNGEVTREDLFPQLFPRKRRVERRVA
jgi:DNA-binding transcriptional regulator YdaS (Cro superfamily)